MADKTKKEVAKILLPDVKKHDENETVSALVQITYSKDARTRGYYYDALIAREKPGTFSDGTTYTQFGWIIFQQSKRYLLEPAPRFNDKKLASLTLTDEQIQTVKDEAVASIRE